MINFGVIGLGVGERHAHAIASHPDARLLAIADFDTDKLAAVHAQFPLARSHTDAAAILADPQIDAVVIASYDNHHFEQIEAALTSGKHVFVEKPICLTAAELTAIEALAAQHKHLKLSSNLILRQAPRFQDLRQQVNAGEFGDLYFVEGDYNYGRLHKIVAGWRGQIPYYSVTFGGAIHVIDLLYWLVDSKVTSVSAMGNKIVSADTTFAYNDFTVCLLKFANGVVGKVSANFGCVYPHFHRMSVYGAKKTFENTLEGGKYYTSRAHQDSPMITDQAYPAVDKGELVRDFVDAIRDDRNPYVLKADVFHVMRVCLAIEESIRTGTEITLD